MSIFEWSLLSRNNSCFHRCRSLTTEQRVLILLRFLAAGSFEQNAADLVRVSQPTVSLNLPIVCDALLNYFTEFIRMPQTSSERQAAALAFHSLAGFPRTIGAIDCTHIKILSPGGLQVNIDYSVDYIFDFTRNQIIIHVLLFQAETFRNRKGYFSLNVQTVSSADLKILDIVERWPGASHDQTIFSASNLKMRFDTGYFGRYIMVGDSGYANTSYLATPYTINHPGLETNPIKRVYQASLIRTRNVVERMYGVLKRRFPVLRHGLNVSLPTAQKLIIAAAILHNICIEEGEVDVDELVENENVEESVNEQLTEDELFPGGNQSARDGVLQYFRIESERHQHRN